MNSTSFLRVSCIVIFSISFNGFAEAQSLRDKRSVWYEDLKSLYDSLQKNHKNLYHLSDKRIFDRKYNEIKNSIMSLSEENIILKFKQLIALAGDGHTYMSALPNEKYFPIEFFIFGQKVTAVKSDYLYKEILGGELVSINRHPIKTILDSLKSIIPKGESTYFTLNKLAANLSLYSNIRGFNFTRTGKIEFQFRKDGKTISAEVLPVDNYKSINWLYAYKKMPLFARSEESCELKLCSDFIDNKDYYIYFAGYPASDQFKKISEKIETDLFNYRPKKIIIDMRNNAGGNFYNGLEYLLPIFLATKALHPDTKYYIVIGRKTFSAGMSNAAQFRDCLGAITIGEPTGARPNGYQENYWFVLPNSKIRISCSQLYYSFQKNNSNGIQPDIYIRPDYNNYSVGMDKVIDFITNH